MSGAAPPPLQRSRLALVAVATAVLALAPAPDAAACSTCFTGGEATRQAYYATTLLLIVLPLAIAGALGLWLRRAARRSRPLTPSR